MKKDYQKPAMVAVEIKPSAILSGSGNVEHDQTAPGTLSRSYVGFDDDEVEE